MRQPAVAGRFYPGTPGELKETLENLFSKQSGVSKQKVLAALSPHAGYIYSGPLAAKTIGAIEVPRSVIIIGPNHHGSGKPIALSKEDWLFPYGVTVNNQKLSDLLLSRSKFIEVDEVAHRHEHSLEVQVPFLQFCQQELTITPLVVANLSFEICQHLAEEIASVIQEYPDDILVLASTDMNHYESREVGGKKDNKALEAILDMSPQELYQTVRDNRISMCGVIPAVITLLTSKLLGGLTSTKIGYTDSGYVSGDTKQVVGYAGVVIQ